MPAGGFFTKHNKKKKCTLTAAKEIFDGRNTMKSSTQDQAEGKFHEAKGKVKEMAGKITDNPKLEGKGKAEKIAGNVQEKIGEVEKVLGG
jgi:uncharacterized protein YjbJ (UPF0337 family)